jgi:hypothetical protein
MQIEVMTGDIVLAQVEVLVTAANTALVGGDYPVISNSCTGALYRPRRRPQVWSG